MPELSNLLRQRLGAAQTGNLEHPEADVLAAFSEQLLLAPERQAVVAHLAVCPECREIVALSQTQAPELTPQIVLKPAPASGWRKVFRPAFGLAGLVAAMAVVAVVILQVQQKPIQQPNQAKEEAKAAPAPLSEPKTAGGQPSADSRPASAPATEARLSAPAGSAGTTRKERDAAPPAMMAGNITAREAVAKPVAPPPAAAMLVDRATKKDFINNDFFASNRDDVVPDGIGHTDLPQAPAPQPGALNSTFATNGTPKVAFFADITPPAKEKKGNTLLLQPSPSQDHFDCALCKVVKQGARTVLSARIMNPSIRSKTLGSSAMGGAGMFDKDLQSGHPAEVASVPEKSEASALEASSAFSASAAPRSFLSRERASTQWKVTGGKLLKSGDQFEWQETNPPAANGQEFTFVIARGIDVWAGGAHAMLVHSRDNGLTWETVKLGDSASGNVVSIVAGSLSVQVRTSDNQLWSSADGGKTWTLRGE